MKSNRFSILINGQLLVDWVAYELARVAILDKRTLDYHNRQFTDVADEFVFKFANRSSAFKPKTLDAWNELAQILNLPETFLEVFVAYHERLSSKLITYLELMSNDFLAKEFLSENPDEFEASLSTEALAHYQATRNTHIAIGLLNPLNPHGLGIDIDGSKDVIEQELLSKSDIIQKLDDDVKELIDQLGCFNANELSMIAMKERLRYFRLGRESVRQDILLFAKEMAYGSLQRQTSYYQQ